MSIKLLSQKSDLQGVLLFKRSARRIEMTFNSPDVRNGAICLSGSTVLEESSVLRQNVVETGALGSFDAFTAIKGERERRKCAVELVSIQFSQSDGLERACSYGLMDGIAAENKSTFVTHDFSSCLLVIGIPLSCYPPCSGGNTIVMVSEQFLHLP